MARLYSPAILAGSLGGRPTNCVLLRLGGRDWAARGNQRLAIRNWLLIHGRVNRGDAAALCSAIFRIEQFRRLQVCCAVALFNFVQFALALFGARFRLCGGRRRRLGWEVGGVWQGRLRLGGRSLRLGHVGGRRWSRHRSRGRGRNVGLQRSASLARRATRLRRRNGYFIGRLAYDRRGRATRASRRSIAGARRA